MTQKQTALRFTETEVESRVDGKVTTALVAACAGCDVGLFSVYQIKGSDHFHLMCAGCGVSYCPFGEC
jgi:hypothetical protein